jgi:hypothetical protein
VSDTITKINDFYSELSKKVKDKSKDTVFTDDEGEEYYIPATDLRPNKNDPDKVLKRLLKKNSKD